MMGTNQNGKRFYQVKVKSLDVTSLKELGRLMGPLQRQAFRKVYGKILDLTAAEVFTEAVVSLAQYYDQPLRCFTFGDFQMVPTIEEFEEILGCPLGGRKPYLFSGFLPSLSKIAAVVGDSAKELDRMKQTRNGIVGLPRKYLEGKARDMASQEKWGPFADILALLIFGVVPFPNVDGLVDLAGIDAFLAYHHSKESPVVAILADLFDTFDRSYRSCAEKGRVDWDQHLAGIGGSAINWFPRWKEGKEGVLFSCGDYLNVPLIGTRGCINYNPALAIRQLGYPMRGAPTEESLSPFLVRDLGAQSLKAIQRVHKAWRNWLSKLKVINEENFKAPKEDEEVQALKLELGKARLAKEKFKSAATHIRKECTELQEENAATARALEQETKRARKEEYGREKFRGALWDSNSELKLRREERDRSRVHGMILKEELVACARSKRSLAQHLEATEQSMLAIIGQYKEELNQSMAHEQKLVEDFAQVYAEKEARGRVIDALHQEATMWMDRFTLTLNGSQDLPRLLAKAKAMAEKPWGGSKCFDHSFAYSCFGGILTVVYFFRNFIITKKTPRHPYNTRSRKMDNEEGMQEQMKADLSTLKDQMASISEVMLKLQKTIEDKATATASSTVREAEPVLQPALNPGRDINTEVFGRSVGWLSFQEEGPNVKTNPLASHGGASVNAVKEDGPSRAKRLREVATSRRFIYQSLQAACMVSRGGDERDECLFHRGESHDMETCPVVEELLQRLMDCGQLEVSIGGREEPQICMQNEFEPGMGLGKDGLGNVDVVDIKGNPYKYGLGYEPGMPGRRNVPSRLRADRVWPGRISQCFTSAGTVSEEEVAAIEEEFPQDPPSFVQPCHPDSQVGNWRVISQSEVYTADSM
ncbi:hypothetical protein GmHk_14G041499 [Glycine max]|nr:hypothetical protein GmHk_14G041499 [Glycine max]